MLQNPAMDGGDPAVETQPGDSVQCMEFSPVQTATGWPLAVGAWDCTVSVYNINPTGGAKQWIGEPMAQLAGLEAPAFDLEWCEPLPGEDAPNGVLFIAYASGMVRRWDVVQDSAPVDWGTHADDKGNPLAARTINFCPSLGAIMTGGWDCALRFWSLAEPNAPIHVEAVPDKVADADVKGNICVVLCRNNMMYIFNLDGGVQPIREEKTTLTKQLRCVALFEPQPGFGPTTKEGSYGFAVGSIEGRVAIK